MLVISVLFSLSTTGCCCVEFILVFAAFLLVIVWKENDHCMLHAFEEF